MMNSISPASIRLNLINSHLTPSSSTLEDRRKQGIQLNKESLFKIYFGPAHKDIQRLREIAINSRYFDHDQDNKLKYEEQRGRAMQQILELYREEKISYESDVKDPLNKLNMMYVLSEYDKSLSTRVTVHFVLYIDTLQNLGTDKHKEFIKRAYKLQDYGCFGMTELGHGSNVLKLETTATYLESTREFSINSPKSTSAKWWIGAAGKTANMAILFAQLIINQESKGVHAFLVPIRDANHNPIKGVVVGDCGPKVSMDRIDNGFMVFKDYVVPYDCLLDRFSSINSEGKFKSSIKNNEKRFGAMLSGLIRGRASVCSSSEITLRCSLTIALRYACISQDYTNGIQAQLIDSQIYYTRLIPALGCMFACRIATLKILELYVENNKIYIEQPESDDVSELHTLLSSLKVLTSSLSLEHLQTLFEICGRFSSYENSAVGRIKYNQDINVTWEGDNTVLIQQVGKFALKNIQKTYKGSPITSKSLSILFINTQDFANFKANFTDFNTIDFSELLRALKYKFNYFLYSSIERLQEKAMTSASMMDAWNNSQAYNIQELGKSFGEYVIAASMLEFCKKLEIECKKTSEVIVNVCKVFIISRLIFYFPYLQESYFNTQQIEAIKFLHLRLCYDLKDSALNIIESLCPPDKLLHSDIGSSGNNIYKNIFTKAKLSSN
jgi:acyl-CoA oxidase